MPHPLTRKEYRHGLKKWEEYYGKTAEETLQERKDDLTQRPNENLVEYRNRAARFEKEIEKFHSWMLQHGFAINSARNLTLGVRQLFRYYEMAVTLRNGSRATKTVKTTRNFPLRIDHVRRMYAVGDLRERLILSMATDLGLRISDFISLLKTDLPCLDDEPPIFFEALTHKEGVMANAFLSKETADLLKTYLQTLAEEKKNSLFLFPSNGSHISDESVNRILKGLAEKANILLNGKDLSFHCFRKMFLAAAVDSGAGLTSGKIICGKSVPQFDDTYLGTANWREKFKQIKAYLTINEQPKQETEKLETLKSAINKLQEELAQQKLISQTVSEENSTIRKTLTTLQPLTDYLQSLGSGENLQMYLLDLDSAKGHLKGVFVAKQEGQVPQFDEAIPMTVKKHRREYDKGDTAKTIKGIESSARKLMKESGKDSKKKR